MRFESGHVVAKAMAVPRGLFCLRYVTADDPETPPAVLVNPAPGFSGDVTVCPGPTVNGQLMCKPGDAVVLSATEDVTMILTIFVPPLAGGDNVKLKLERLDYVNEAEQPEEMAALLDSASDALLPVSLEGHVELHGDVSAKPGAWLGSPRGRRWVEGFAVHWGQRPMNVDILYGCVAAQVGRLPETLTGGFVGTRGRGLPLYGISAKLMGEQSSEYELAVEGAFADGTTIGPIKSPVDITSSSGTVPIVGLRFTVTRAGRRDSSLLSPVREITPGLAHRDTGLGNTNTRRRAAAE